MPTPTIPLPNPIPAMPDLSGPPTDFTVKQALEWIVERRVADLRVIPLLLLDFEATQWPAILRSLSNNKIINGLLITRVSRRQRKFIGYKEMTWDYALLYFRSYASGAEGANGEDLLNATIEAIDGSFDEYDTLGFEDADHDTVHGIGDGWQVNRIDLIDSRLYMVQSQVTVSLSKTAPQ